MIFRLILGAVLSYLLGSLNFGIILSRKFQKEDVRTHGSGNAGSTNMLRNYGKLPAVATILGDMAKVAVAILLVRLLVGNDLYAQQPIFIKSFNMLPSKIFVYHKKNMSWAYTPWLFLFMRSNPKWLLL